MEKKRVLARVMAEDLRNVVGGCGCEENQGTVGYTYDSEGHLSDLTNYGGDED